METLRFLGKIIYLTGIFTLVGLVVWYLLSISIHIAIPMVKFLIGGAVFGFILTFFIYDRI